MQRKQSVLVKVPGGDRVKGCHLPVSIAPLKVLHVRRGRRKASFFPTSLVLLMLTLVPKHNLFLAFTGLALLMH